MDKNKRGKPRFSGECRRVKLNEICSKGKSSLRQKDVINDGPYSVYGASGVIGTTGDYQNEIPYVAVVKDGAGVGRASACEPRTSVLGTMQALIPNSNVERDYLLHLVRSLRLGEGFSGSTIPHIYFKDYGKLEVPLPSLEAQKQIASQLGLVEEQIAQAEAQIEQLDQLVKSRFIEMFGDPVANTMEWKTSPVDEICPQCSSKTPTVGQVWQLGLEMIEPDSGRVTSKTIVDARSLKSSNTGFSSSHVLYSKLRPYLNKVVLPDDDGVCTTELVPLLPKHDVLERTYLCYLLRSKPFVDYISKQVAGAKMPRVDMKKFKAFQVPVPPFNFQQEFAAFVAQVDKLRFKTQQQIEKLEMLKKSLMQDYFG